MLLVPVSKAQENPYAIVQCVACHKQTNTDLAYEIANLGVHICEDCMGNSVCEVDDE